MSRSAPERRGHSCTDSKHAEAETKGDNLTLRCQEGWRNEGADPAERTVTSSGDVRGVMDK